MKKRTIYYLPLICLLLLTGCQKEDATLPVEGQGDALVFNASVDGLSFVQSDASVSTRAVADMKVTDFEQYGFDIAGYYTVGDFDANKATAYPNVFDKDANDSQIPVPRVTKNASSHATAPNKYSLKTVKWELNDNGRLSFFAWGQNRMRKGEVEGVKYGIQNYTKTIADKGYPWIDVTLGSGPNDQADVVGARVMNEKNDAVISSVDLEFHHLLSKVTIKAKSSTGNKIVFSSAKLRYVVGKVNLAARYTFGNTTDKLGAWSNHSATHDKDWSFDLDGKTATITSGTEAKMGDLLLIPQNLTAGSLCVDVTYQVEIAPGVMSQTITRALPAPALELQENTNHVLTLDFTDNDQIVFNTSIAPWTEVTHNTLPYIPGPCGPDVMLELDGSDPPFYDIATDKWYWLDRSGWNRHVELSTIDGRGYTGYDKVNYCYQFTQNQNDQVTAPGGLIPGLGGGNDEMTVDLICETETGSLNTLWQVALWLSNDPNTGIGSIMGRDNRQLAFTVTEKSRSDVIIDKDGYETGRMKTAFESYDYARQKTYWTAQANATNLRLYRNGSLKNEKSVTGLKSLGNLQKNFLAPYFNGKIYYLKLTRKTKTGNEVLAGYTKIAPKFRIPRDPVIPKPPVNDGLILQLDGYVAPNVVGDKNVWADQSANAVHAEILGTSWTGSGYQFDGSGYMKTQKDLTAAAMDNFTVEVIFASNNIMQTTYTPIVIGTSKNNPTDQNYRPFYMGMTKSSSILEWSTGYFTNDANTYRMYWKDPAAIRTDLRVVQAVRSVAATTNIIYDNGEEKLKETKAISGGTRWSIGSVVIGTWHDTFRDKFTGEIKGIYIHNKALSAEEIAQNAEWYKAYYGIE